ncbi:hypothetical protein D3C72_2342670 [compost metagenome]
MTVTRGPSIDLGVAVIDCRLSSDKGADMSMIFSLLRCCLLKIEFKTCSRDFEAVAIDPLLRVLAAHR